MENGLKVKKVYEAISAVQGKLAEIGIAKKQKGPNYLFRGIDDIYGALSKLLAEYKLCILPRVTKRDSEERETKNGGRINYVTVHVEYAFVSAEDGSMHFVTVVGEAMDSADKATNKAMSAAYKYACLQTFCIPTEGDNDADATTHDVKVDPRLAEIQSATKSIREAAKIGYEEFKAAWKEIDPEIRKLIPKDVIEECKTSSNKEIATA